MKIRETPLTSWVVALKGLAAGSFILGSILNDIWLPFQIVIFIAGIVITLDSAIPYGRPNYMGTLSIFFVVGLAMAYASWVYGFGREWVFVMALLAVLVYLYRAALTRVWKRGGGKPEEEKKEEKPEEKGRPSPAEMEQARKKLEEMEEKKEEPKEEKPAKEEKKEEPEGKEDEEKEAEEEEPEDEEETEEDSEEKKEEADSEKETEDEGKDEDDEEETEEQKKEDEELRKQLKKVLE